MDSGISETNLTLVFQLFQTIELKQSSGGFSHLRAVIVFSFGKAKAGGEEKRGSHNRLKTQGGKCFHT